MSLSSFTVLQGIYSSIDPTFPLAHTHVHAYEILPVLLLYKNTTTLDGSSLTLLLVVDYDIPSPVLMSIHKEWPLSVIICCQFTPPVSLKEEPVSFLTSRAPSLYQLLRIPSRHGREKNNTIKESLYPSISSRLPSYLILKLLSSYWVQYRVP